MSLGPPICGPGQGKMLVGSWPQDPTGIDATGATDLIRHWYKWHIRNHVVIVLIHQLQANISDLVPYSLTPVVGTPVIGCPYYHLPVRFPQSHSQSGTSCCRHGGIDSTSRTWHWTNVVLKFPAQHVDKNTVTSAWRFLLCAQKHQYSAAEQAVLSQPVTVACCVSMFSVVTFIAVLDLPYFYSLFFWLHIDTSAVTAVCWNCAVRQSSIYHKMIIGYEKNDFNNHEWLICNSHGSVRPTVCFKSQVNK